MSSRDAKIEWSEEARGRLSAVPRLLRSMVRTRAEALASERGETCVTGQLLTELRNHGPGGSGSSSGRSVWRRSGHGSIPEVVWTDAARERREASPAFFQSEIARIAEEAARAGGHLEVNLALLDRLESEEELQRHLSWTPAAERALEAQLSQRPKMARVFVSPAMEEAAERIARSASRKSVRASDVERAFETDGAGIDWSPTALARVRNAPEFVRAGIKKAAEAGARREGLERIEEADLTRLRNRAMMRAVKRMRAFGFRELTFDVFETAEKRVPRLRDNPQAKRRFAAIRAHVEGSGGLGVIDSSLLARMREFLRSGGKGGL